MGLKELIQSMRGSQYTLMLSAMFGTIGVMGMYKLFVKPEMDRKRREEASVYADFVFQAQQEHSRIEQ